MNFEMWLQSQLTAHGFPVGPIDGIVGPKTRAAIKAFQKRWGLKVTSVADVNTVAALRADPAAITPPDQVKIPDRDADLPEESPPVSPIWPRQADCPTFYGEVGTNQTQIAVPFDMVLAWDKSVKLRKMTLHTKVAPGALRVLEKASAIFSRAERENLGLNLFGGSLNVRKMRGGTKWSMHAWGIAIDFDPQRNALTTHAPKSRLSQADARPWWELWEAEGWLSLGRSRDFDWMHVQAARL